MPGPAAAQQVLTYHGDAARSGRYVVPSLTWGKAGMVHMDPGFNATIQGHVYGQPLYWVSPETGQGEIIVATESDIVYALDATTGAEIWHRALGQPVPGSVLPCGRIDPSGVTSTPVIDAAHETLYLNAMVQQPAGPRHMVFGLSLAHGYDRKGWPIDVGTALAGQGLAFIAPDQDQRSALALVNGRLYVPFAANAGDCASYRGWVVGFTVTPPAFLGAWETRARSGGIWAQGGVVYDGTSLFVATGNTRGTTTWQDGEAVIRLPPDLTHSSATTDYFAPTDWLYLDQNDLDLGGTAPTPIDVATATGTAHWLIALGKDGNAYLLDRANLGGIGGQLLTYPITAGPIDTGPATYTTPAGTYVVGHVGNPHCPDSESGGLAAILVTGGPPPGLGVAWCQASHGSGSPIVTTTDGTANPIVWMPGAEGSNRLYGYRGTDGKLLFNGGGAGDQMTGLRHFETLLAANGRFYVGADGRIYAFLLPG